MRHSFSAARSTKLTNKRLSLCKFPACYARSVQRSLHYLSNVETNNFRRLLRTVEALSDLGPELTAERDFTETVAPHALRCHGSGRRARRRAFCFQREAHHAHLRGVRRLRHACPSRPSFRFFPNMRMPSPPRADRLCSTLPRIRSFSVPMATSPRIVQVHRPT